MSGANLVFILTGSIAAFKACEVISQLVQRGHRVRTVATEAAQKFIGVATLEGLTGSPALSDLFAAGAALEHIALTRWADAVVICPATANTINRLAAGLADDFPGALFLAHDRAKPFLVAPAMNPAMWAHPATVTSVEKLQGWGVQFTAVAHGRTACGEVGEGRLLEPALIVAAIESALAQPARRLRVLVTSGGTSQPIDAVRVLGNTSTGRTGASLADHLSQRGHEVVLLRARGSQRPEGSCRQELFVSFADLDASLERLMRTEDFDAVIHAAAVSDFTVTAFESDGIASAAGTGKFSNNSGAMTLKLDTNPKLVDSLRLRSRNPAVKIVAFKLTAGITPAAAVPKVADLFRHSGADFVVHNDLSERQNGEVFPATIYAQGVLPSLPCATRAELAETLERLLVAEVSGIPDESEFQKT